MFQPVAGQPAVVPVLTSNVLGLSQVQPDPLASHPNIQQKVAFDISTTAPSSLVNFVYSFLNVQRNYIRHHCKLMGRISSIVRVST